MAVEVAFNDFTAEATLPRLERIQFIPVHIRLR